MCSQNLIEHHALGGEHPLELEDLAVRPRPFLLGGELLHALDQHAPIPGAVEHREVAPPRQRRPEAPQEVVALGGRVGRGELRDAHVAGVERGHQALDRAALAGGVPALEEDAHGRAEVPVVAQSGERQPQRE